jgi:hypothetical protein
MITSSFPMHPTARRGVNPEATKVVNDHFQGGQRKAPNILDV